MAESLHVPGLFGNPVISRPPRAERPQQPHPHRGRTRAAAAFFSLAAMVAGATASTPSGREGSASGAGNGEIPSTTPRQAGGVPVLPEKTSGAGSGKSGGTYDNSHNITCKGLRVEKSKPGTWHLVPLLGVEGGNPDPSRFATVVDVFEGSGTGSELGHKTYVSTGGVGKPVDIPIPPEPIDYKDGVTTVAIAYYPPSGGMPPEGDASGYSISSSAYPQRLMFACGNAVVAWLTPGHTTIG